MREPSTMLNWRDPKRLWAKVINLRLIQPSLSKCECRQCNEGDRCGSITTHSVKAIDGYGKVVFGRDLCEQCYDIDIANGLMGCCEFNSDGDIVIKSSASRRPYRVERSDVVTGERCGCWHRGKPCNSYAKVKETVINRLGEFVGVASLCDDCCDTNTETMLGRCNNGR